MARYWIIAPYSSKKLEVFNGAWQFDLTNNVISIGWSGLGDVLRMSREDLSEAVDSSHSNLPVQTRSLIANMLWAFYHEIRPGDIILARRGRKTLAGVGTVSRQAVWAPGKNQILSSVGDAHNGFIEVDWRDVPRDKTFSHIVFPMHTLAEASEEQYLSFTEGDPRDTAHEPVGDLEDHSEFVLERYLEDFIVSNFENIFRGRLEIYEDGQGADGQQYATEVGPIDILAREVESGAFVVIELKKGRPSDQVVGQILRYMGWVKRNLCADAQDVKGLVICHDHDPRLSYAIEMTKGIDVRYYSVAFTLKEAP